MTALQNIIHTKSPYGSPLIQQYIQSAQSLSIQIVAIESATPALTREQLKSIFNARVTQPAELISSATEMEQWLKIVSAQLQEELEEKVKLPLILLAPTSWPDFNDLLEEVEDKFEGPIFLVDNSCTAANWAEAVLRVDAYGQILEVHPLVAFF